MKAKKPHVPGGISRRDFIKGAAAGAVGVAAVGALAACENPTNTEYVELNPEDYWLGDPPVITNIKETIEADVVIVGAGHAGIQAALAAAEGGASVSVIEEQPEDTFRVYGEDAGLWNSQWHADKGFVKYDEGEVVSEFVKRSAGRVNPALISSYVKNSGELLDNMVRIINTEGDPDNIMLYGREGYGASFEETRLIVQVQKGVALDEYPIELGGFKTWATTLQFSGGQANSDLHKFELYAVNESKKLDAKWYFGNTATVLATDEDGTVTGCIAQDANGDYIKYVGKKATLVTTGDFGGNNEMCYALLDEASNWAIYNGKTKEEVVGRMGRKGAGHKMCCWAGGRMEPAPRGTMNMGGGPNGPWGMAPFFWLNAEGNRFCNEASAPGAMGAVSRQPTGLMATVTDKKWFQSVLLAGLEHGGPNFGHWQYYYDMQDDMDAVVPGPDGSTVRGVVIGQGPSVTVYRADDLRTLLGYLGYTGTALTTALASIDRYNELCTENGKVASGGVDLDYGKDAKAMLPINEAPYYGVKGNNAHGSDSIGLVTLAGVLTDDNMQVLDKDYKPIKGLYVAGNTLGGRYGVGYTTPCAGNSVGMAMTHGRVLGKYAAKLSNL